LYLAINPVALDFGVIEIRWYGIILGIAALSGLLIVIQEGKRYEIDSGFFMDMLLIGAPSAIIAARAYYVIFKWEDFRNNLWDIFKIWNGGIAIYGALIGALISSFFYFRAKGYNFWRIADICAPGLIVGQIIGRWGNFVNQEAHGGTVSKEFLQNTLHLPDFIINQMNISGIFYHPTFLYESFWNLIGLLLLFWLRRRPFLLSGELVMSYFIWYSIGRFFVEGLRTDSLAFDGPTWLIGLMDVLWSPMSLLFEAGSMDYGNVRVSQLLGVFIFIIAVSIIVYRRKYTGNSVRYSDPIISSKELL